MANGYDEYGDPQSAEDLVIGETAVIESDADQTEADSEERRFFELGPGTHQLQVVGFAGKPKKERKTLYLQGQAQQVELTSIIVRFGLASDTRHQVTDLFIIPPDTPTELAAYNHGSTKPDGSTSGFHAEKFGHFLNRLIGGFSKGSKLPPAARHLKNWIGKPIVAEVVKGKDSGKVNPATGLPYPPRNQVRLYSYRRADGAASVNPNPAPDAHAARRPTPEMSPGVRNI